MVGMKKKNHNVCVTVRVQGSRSPHFENSQFSLFQKKRDTNHSPQLQRLARKLKFPS